MQAAKGEHFRISTTGEHSNWVNTDIVYKIKCTTDLGKHLIPRSKKNLINSWTFTYGSFLI